MAELVHKIESYKVIGACFEGYNKKGYGFTEPVYQECLTIELELPKKCKAESRRWNRGYY